jgi:hypothetical protein
VSLIRGLERLSNSFINRKIVQLIESFSQDPEKRDLDQEVIHTMQKWDLNTGTAQRKPQPSSVTTGSGIGVSAMVVPYEKTISYFTNRLYLDALLRKGRFEEFFGTVVDLANVSLFSCHECFKRLRRAME